MESWHRSATSEKGEVDMGKKNWAAFPKPDGWFSRRHQTSEAHIEAREAYKRKEQEKRSLALRNMGRSVFRYY